MYKSQGGNPRQALRGDYRQLMLRRVTVIESGDPTFCRVSWSIAVSSDRKPARLCSRAKKPAAGRPEMMKVIPKASLAPSLAVGGLLPGETTRV